MNETDADRLARRVAAFMTTLDTASSSLGIDLVSARTRHAIMTMSVRADMLNGHGICHGGYVFSLADSACAFASCSEGQVMVLQSSTITYLNPAHAGDRLTATATMTDLRGRTGIVDVAVETAGATRIALFRGIVRSVGASVLPPDRDGSPAAG